MLSVPFANINLVNQQKSGSLICVHIFYNIVSLYSIVHRRKRITNKHCHIPQGTFIDTTEKPSLEQSLSEIKKHGLKRWRCRGSRGSCCLRPGLHRCGCEFCVIRLHKPQQCCAVN